MPKITLDIPEENVALLMEVTEALGINKKDLTVIDGIPEWHKQVLNERITNYKAGKTSATPWEEFEKGLDKEDEDD